MARAPSAFRQSDVSRAVRAATAAGMQIDRVEIDPIKGKIVVVAAGKPINEPVTEFDRWKASHARKA